MPMGRPKATIENSAALYKYYAERETARPVSYLLHGIASVAFAPHVRFQEGAEERIKKILAEGKHVVLASNHTRNSDSGAMAALMLRQRAFRPLIGTTIGPAKPSLFKHFGLRHGFEALGAVPVWRKQDKDDLPPEQQRHWRPATLGFLRFATAQLNKDRNGRNMGIFPEGTRNKGDATTVQPLDGGIGYIVSRVSEGNKPSVVPIGISYPDKGLYGRSPNLYVGMPSTEPFNKGKELMDWLAPQLQTCVDLAANIGV